MADKKTMIFMGDDCELAIFCDEVTEDKQNERIYGYRCGERIFIAHSDKVNIVEDIEGITHNTMRIEFVEATNES